MTEKISERTIQGRVVSDKMQKTLVVLVDRRVRHPLYGKYLSRWTKFYVHYDPAANTVKEGDTVTITASRPISKLKKWRLVEVVSKA